MLRELAASGVEAGGAILGGLAGGAVTSPTGPGALAGVSIGAGLGGTLARPVADYIRGKPTTGRGLASNFVTSAIPGGKAAKVGGGLVKRGLAYALEGAAIGGLSTEARSLIEEGELASVPELATGVVGGGVVGGALGTAIGRRPLPELPTAAAPIEGAQLPLPGIEPAEAVAEAAAKIGREKGAKGTEAMQLGLFDPTGHVRPELNQPLGLLTRVRASTVATKEMTDAVKAEGAEAAEILASTTAAEEKQRLYRQVGEAFKMGQIDSPELLKTLQAEGLSMTEWIDDYYTPSIKAGARQLQQLSSLRQFLNAIDDPEAKAALAGLSKAKTSNQLLEFLQKLDDTRRGLLISQVKTGVRNAFSQGIAYGTDLVEQAASQFVGGEGDFFGSLESAVRAFNRPQSKAAIQAILKHRRDLQGKLGELEYDLPSTFLDSRILAPTVGRFVKATTYINRAQEEFFRRAVFDSTVRQGLKAKRMDVARALANPKTIPDDILEKATDRALELTFAHRNPGGLEDWVTGAQLMRPISTLIAPFPRYLANAVTYIAKRNPLGLARLATKHGRANAGQVGREAFVGTLLLGGALAARFKAGGEKWYELKYGDKRLDTRGVLGPFGAYLFMADAIKRKLETGKLDYSPEEYIEGILSMSRVAGTLQQLASFLKSKKDDPRPPEQKLEALVGEWISGFATPAKNIKDALILGGNEEEAKFRDVREERPIIAPSMQAIPGLSQTLPERPKLTTGEPMKSEAPVASFLLGLNIRTTDAVEREINRLGLPIGDLAPRTGIPKADRALTRSVGKAIAAIGPKLVAKQGYQRLTDGEKIMVLKEMFKRARAAASQHLISTQPKLAAAVKAKRSLSTDERRVLEERGIDVGAKIERLTQGKAPAAAATTSTPTAAPPTPTTIVQKGKVTPEAVSSVATLVGLSPSLLTAVVNQESGGQVDIRAPKTPNSGGERATGVMQILPSTFKLWAERVSQITGKPASITNPLDNLIAGALIYKSLLEEHGDVATAARFYHGGPNTRIHGPKTEAYGEAVAAGFAAQEGE